MAKNHPTYVSFGNDVLRPLQICTSEDCNWTTALGKTRTKCSQMVTAPYVMQKPLVIGASERHVSSPALYHIKPGTHAHVINYMVIDKSSDLIEKVKSGDPEV